VLASYLRGIFEELAWTKKAFLGGIFVSELIRYRAQAEERVIGLQRKSEEAVKGTEVEHSRKGSKHAIKATGIELFLKEPQIKVTGWETDLERQTQQRVYLDRHVLYEPSFRDGPYLVNCVRPLDGKTLQHTVEKANNIWIYNYNPCINTYTHDLSALVFMLGMKLEDNSRVTQSSGMEPFACR
jgi:hypothetical protein